MAGENKKQKFRDEQIALASSNYEAQEWLLRELAKAFHMSRRTIAELAEELGLDQAEAQTWLDGDVDLTLSELRQLANAVDAKVSYRVGALTTRYAERFGEIEGNNQWLKTGATWSERTLVAP